MGSKVDRYKKLGIPRRFQIHGHQVTVRIIQLSRWRHPKAAVGIYDPNRHRIDLRGDLGDTEIGQVFCHELSHCLLSEMNHPLNDCEVFVDNLGSLLHQALQTFTTATK